MVLVKGRMAVYDSIQEASDIETRSYVRIKSKMTLIEVSIVIATELMYR